MFAALRDGPSLRVEAPRPIDIAPECAAMLERLCLAQAQEVVFEKSRADAKSPGTLARCVTTPWAGQNTYFEAYMGCPACHVLYRTPNCGMCHVPVS